MPGAGPAWDIYLFYRPGDRWSTSPPMPCEWWHQLGLRRPRPVALSLG
jgi:hypothetical protein